jgi:hypothetical protein
MAGRPVNRAMRWNGWVHWAVFGQFHNCDACWSLSNVTTGPHRAIEGCSSSEDTKFIIPVTTAGALTPITPSAPAFLALPLQCAPPGDREKWLRRVQQGHGQPYRKNAVLCVHADVSRLRSFAFRVGSIPSPSLSTPREDNWWPAASWPGWCGSVSSGCRRFLLKAARRFEAEEFDFYEPPERPAMID